MDMDPNTTVQVNIPHVHFTARFIREENSPDGQPNGIALVEVTDKGNSWHKVGRQLHVGTRTLTPVED
jgi:hypothetical protein